MKSTKKTFTTPKAVASYPYLTKPDFQFNPDGTWQTKLRLSEKEAKPLMDEVKAVVQSEFGDKAGKAYLPFKKNDETGEIEFLTKSKFKPKFVDSSGAMIAEHNVPAIFGGSVIKVAGTISPYNTGGKIGVTLQMGGVQIIELAEAQGTSFEFGAEQGGFVADNDNSNSADGAAYNF